MQWEGQTGHTARSLLAEPAVGDGDNAAIDRWLTEFLKDGRQKATDVYAAADASGYSKDKAKRAKKALGVDGGTRRCRWSLVLGATEPHAAARERPLSSDPRLFSLAPLLPCRSQHP